METSTNSKSEELEIDLMEILAVLMDKVAVIVLVSVICAAIMLVYTKFFIDPTYVSKMQVYVTVNEQITSAQNTNISQQDLVASSYLTTDSKTIIKSDYVLKKVIEELRLDLSCDELKEKISVDTPSDSRIITISVKDKDPWQTKRILDSVTKYSKERISYVVGVDTIRSIDEEAKIGSKVGPNLKLNVLLGFIGGFVLAVIIIILRFMLDDTIKVQEDVEKYLGLSVLGLIPEIETNDNKKKKKKKLA